MEIMKQIYKTYIGSITICLGLIIESWYEASPTTRLPVLLGWIGVAFNIGIFFYIHCSSKVIKLFQGEWDKSKSLYRIAVVIFAISLLYIFASFIPKPNVLKNWQNLDSVEVPITKATWYVSQIETLTILQTQQTGPTAAPIITPMQSAAPTPTQIVTPIPPTPTATSTSFNYTTTVCLFDLGQDNKGNDVLSNPIRERLEHLGFNVSIVAISDPVTYQDCKVLYLSKGWINKRSELENEENLESIGEILVTKKTGLLIGNPGITEGTFTLNLFDFPIIYSFLSEEKISELNPSSIWTDANRELTDDLLQDLDNNNSDSRYKLPVPESKLFIDVDEEEEKIKNYTYNFLVCGGDGGRYLPPGLIVSSKTSVQRYILMPGSEDPGGLYSIEDYLFVRFINWLARR
ncbi:MAG: hypothetical protein WA116_09860 [Anaerolineaceae bacterium]